MKAQLEDYTKVVPAKKTVSALPYPGTQFLCFAVSGATLQVKFDSGNYIPVLAGLKITLPTNDSFHSVTFQNTGNADVTVSFYVSAGLQLELTKVT